MAQVREAEFKKLLERVEKLEEQLLLQSKPNPKPVVVKPK